LSAADLANHREAAGDGRTGAPRRWTLIATLLGHAIVLALFVVDWRWQPPPEPEAIEVRLVMLPPPKPAPPPAPPRPIEPRQSGPQEQTTAPPPAEVEAPKITTPPAEAPPVPETPPAPVLAPPAPAERPVPVPAARAKPRKEAVPSVVRKEAPVAMAPHVVSLSPPGRAPAEIARSGDRYLNTLRDLIERKRSYPPPEAFRSPSGAVAAYQIVVDRSGRLMGVTILQSTGVSKLDEVAGLMIRDAAPFPPLPADYPDLRALITVEIPIYPAPR